MGAKSNLLIFLQKEGVKNADFYKKTGLSNGFLDKNENISSRNIEIIISNYPNISLEWLLTGKGEMLKENKQTIGNIEKSSVVGANVNGSGININSNQSELIDIIKKQQDQIGQLIDVISKLKEI